MKPLKNWIRKRLRHALALPELEDQIREIRQFAEFLPEIKQHLMASNVPSGGFALFLEYPPSRDYRPRWGYTHPPHPELTTLFEKNRQDYIKRFEELASLQPYLAQINRDFSHERPGEPGWFGGAINAIDSALLYYFIARTKPKIYLEIGSGVTTLFAAKAKRDHQLATQIISLDPKPRAEVNMVCDEVIREGLETADLSIFSQLQPGDIVFVDGTHRSFMNSDVTVFILDILPKLQPGVIVHVHDITLPFDYPQEFSHWYWNEQYILAAYLLGKGDEIEVLMPSKFMSNSLELKDAIAPLLETWPEDNPHWLEGGSLWFTHL
ncbi:class I SAM-dependent methyltransferase [Lusitaniella coriacea]|uniref:class I SAM-dependent methyltransferase n=1 Tax=Lusitaniella coriacea TaxID=1983105 RepID=UPI003CF5D28C